MAEVTGTPPVEYRNVGASTPQTQTGWQPQATPEATETSMTKLLMAEYLGTFALVFAIVSGAYWWYPDFFAMGLTAGIAVAVLVTAFSGLGSGQFNPAISLGLMLSGRQSWKRTLAVILVQLKAGVLACYVLAGYLGPNENAQWIQRGPVDQATGQQQVSMMDPVAAGTPRIPERVVFPEPIGQVPARTEPGSHRISTLQGIVLETMLTFLWGMAVFAGLRKENRKALGLLVGGAVAAGILVGGVFTGAAMNPVRAFGPALISGQWEFQMIYWVGPLLGGALAGVVGGYFLFPKEEEQEVTPLTYPGQ